MLGEEAEHGELALRPRAGTGPVDVERAHDLAVGAERHGDHRAIALAARDRPPRREVGVALGVGDRHRPAPLHREPRRPVAGRESGRLVEQRRVARAEAEGAGQPERPAAGLEQQDARRARADDGRGLRGDAVEQLGQRPAVGDEAADREHAGQLGHGPERVRGRRDRLVAVAGRGARGRRARAAQLAGRHPSAPTLSHPTATCTRRRGRSPSRAGPRRSPSCLLAEVLGDLLDLLRRPGGGEHRGLGRQVLGGRPGGRVVVDDLELVAGFRVRAVEDRGDPW